MTFPEGVTVNASSAQGLGACSQAQIGIGNNNAPQCPEASKLGTVSIDTPLLSEQLKGSVYLATQGDNPFNSLLALYIAVKGPGFWLKLPGKIEADPETGQLTTIFDDNPQLPFSNLHLQLAGGPRAALSVPVPAGPTTSAPSSPAGRVMNRSSPTRRSPSTRAAPPLLSSAPASKRSRMIRAAAASRRSPCG